MKRGKPLGRTKPLRSRKAPMKRGGPLVAKPIDGDELLRRQEVRRQVFDRDGWRCQLRDVPGAGDCFGGLTFHHRRKEGQGGGYTVENGAALCAHHNDQIEADVRVARIAHARGLVVLRGD